MRPVLRSQTLLAVDEYPNLAGCQTNLAGKCHGPWLIPAYLCGFWESDTPFTAHSPVHHHFPYETGHLEGTSHFQTPCPTRLRRLSWTVVVDLVVLVLPQRSDQFPPPPVAIIYLQWAGANLPNDLGLGRQKNSDVYMSCLLIVIICVNVFCLTMNDRCFGCLEIQYQDTVKFALWPSRGFSGQLPWLMAVDSFYFHMRRFFRKHLAIFQKINRLGGLKTHR